MTWADYIIVWLAFGLVTYVIKLINYKDSWMQEGNRIFFVAVLIAALAFGPIGLLFTIINSKGKPF